MQCAGEVDLHTENEVKLHLICFLTRILNCMLKVYLNCLFTLKVISENCSYKKKNVQTKEQGPDIGFHQVTCCFEDVLGDI